jgi:hypothetical protein
MATDVPSSDVPRTTRGTGWLSFAGIMLIIAGVTRIIDALWVFKRENELDDAPALEDLVIFDDNIAAWGWFYLIVGLVLIVAGFAVFGRAQWARWLGIVFTSIAIFMHFGWMYAYPVQALIGVVIDVLVLYALAAYGGRDEVYY